MRYPLKPPDIADDIESFIYVVLYMVMRFYRHHMSLPLEYKLATEEVQKRAIRADPYKLSDLVHSFFYAEEPGKRGFSKGGLMKFALAKSGIVPVMLLPNEDGSPSSLQTFLMKAFDMMKVQYDTFDYTHLGQYDPNNLNENEARAVAHSVQVHLHDDDPTYNPFVDMKFAWPPKDWRSRMPSAITNAAVSKKEGPLDSHEDMTNLLCEMFKDNKLDRNLDDHFLDQFNGLRVMVATESKNPSGRSKTDTKSGSKPKEKVPTPVLDSSTTEDDPASSPTPPPCKPGKRVRISDELDICEPGENGLQDRSLATLPSVVPPPATPPLVRRSARLARATEAPRLPTISEKKQKRGHDDEDEDGVVAGRKTVGVNVVSPAKKAAAPRKVTQTRKRTAKAPKVRVALKAPPTRKPSTPPKAAEAQVRRSTRLVRKGADRRA